MKTKINWRNSINFVVGADNIRLQKPIRAQPYAEHGVNLQA